MRDFYFAASIVFLIFSAASSANGLKFKYYEGQYDSLPDLTKKTPVAEGISSSITVNAYSKRRSDNFLYAFEGYLKISQAGEYKFSLDSDDGSKLFIDDKPVVDNGGLHGRRVVTGNKILSKGHKKIRVLYFEKRGNQFLKLEYQGPGISKRVMGHNELVTSLPKDDSNIAPSLTIYGNETRYLDLTANAISLTFAGKVTDSDGNINKIDWSQTSGPNQGSIIASKNSIVTKVTFELPGTYTFRCIAEDNDGGTAAASRTVIVYDKRQNKPQDPGPTLGKIEKLKLSPKDVFLLNDGKSSGDSGRLLDQQDIVLDPLNGDRVALDPAVFWKSTNGYHLNHAVIDFGEEVNLKHILVYDTQGVGEIGFSSGSPSSSKKFKTYIADGYKVWRQLDVDVMTRYLTVTNQSGYLGVPEIVLYGKRWSNSPQDDGPIDSENPPVANHPTPQLPEPSSSFGSEGHEITFKHVNLSCSSCDKVLEPKIGGKFNYDPNFKVPDGLLCLKAGTYNRVSLANIEGKENAPVRIRNCGGQVVIKSSANGGFLFSNSKYIDISGVGSASHLYGIEINAPIGEGFKIRTFSSDIEVSYVRVRTAGTTGFKFKPEYNGSNLSELRQAVMKNLHIHHTKVDFAGTMEGHYVGNTSCDGSHKDEQYLSTDAWLEDVEFHDNIIIDAGADGVQFACIRGLTHVYHNTVLKAGERTFNDRTDQDWGIQLGPDLELAAVHNNYLQNIEKEAFHINPKGPGHHIEIYNNKAIRVKSAAYVNASVAYANGTFTLKDNVFGQFTVKNGELFRVSMINKNSNAGKIEGNLFKGQSPKFLIEVDRSAEPQKMDDYTNYINVGNSF